MNNLDEQFLKYVNKIIKQEISKMGLQVGQWHLGKVDSVTSTTKLKVFIDGSTTSQTVSCNPDVTFSIGDYVWVVYINGNPRDKFVLCKRGI